MKVWGSFLCVLAATTMVGAGCSSSDSEPAAQGTAGAGGGGGSGGVGGATGGDVSLEPFAPPEKNVIIGQVVTKSGIPLKGVTVTIEGGKKGTTNYDGMYYIADVPANERTVVTFSGPGYITTTRSVATHADGKAIVNGILMGRMGAVALSGGTAKNESGTVKLAEGAAVDANGKAAATVRVQMTPIDIKGRGIRAAPGDFSAMNASNKEVQLETFGMSEFQLTDENGQPLKIKEGEKATVELLLPSDTTLKKGDKVPAWHFDEKTSRWIEEGQGEVVEYSQDASRLAFRAEVGHFSSWNCDKEMETTCVKGKILKCDGTPASGADIQSNGLDYDGTSSAGSNPSGEYCLNVKKGAKVHLVAAANYGSQRLVNVLDITAPNTEARCPSGPCMEQDIKLPCTPEESPVDCDETYFVGCRACVKGKVVDKSGNPAKAVVKVNSGLTAMSVVTAADGSYTAPAAEGSMAVITATGANKKTGQTSVIPKSKGPVCEQAPDIVLDTSSSSSKDEELEFTFCPKEVGGLTIDSYIVDGADPAFSSLNGAWIQISPTAGSNDQGKTRFSVDLRMINTNEKSLSQAPKFSVSLDLESAPTGPAVYTNEGEPEGYSIQGDAHSSLGGVVGMSDQTFSVASAGNGGQKALGTAKFTFDQAFSKEGDPVTGSFELVMASACSPKNAGITLKGKINTKVGPQLGILPSVFDVNAPAYKQWQCSMIDMFSLGASMEGSKGVVQAYVQDVAVKTTSNFMNGSNYSWSKDKLQVTLYGEPATLLFSVEHPVSGANQITSVTLVGVGGDGCAFKVKSGTLNLETAEMNSSWWTGNFDIMMTKAEYAEGDCPDQHVTGQLGAAVCR